MDLLSAICIALGLAASAATQMRIAGVPLGPGEAFLLAGLLIAAGQRLTKTSHGWTFGGALVALFWGAFLSAEALGFVTGRLMGVLSDHGLVLHDVATYPILIALTLLIVSGDACAARLLRAEWLLASLGAFLIVLQLANGSGLFAIPRVDPWYWDRFRGWAANPNQLALQCLILTLLALHLFDAARTRRAKAAALLCLAAPATAGFIAKTNAFNLALAGAGVVYGMIWVGRLLLAKGPRLAAPVALVWVLVLGGPVALASGIIWGVDSGYIDVSSALSRDDARQTDEEAALRFELWHEALERGVTSHLLGYGPGPHLPIPAVLLTARWGTTSEPINVDHPQLGDAPNFEAHNSLLELFVQGGLLAVVSFLSLFIASLVTAIRSGQPARAMLLCSLMLFGSFHVVTRHPLVWYVIAGALVTGASRQAAGEARSHTRIVASTPAEQTA